MCNVQRGQSQKIATFSKLELKYSIFPFDDGKMKRSRDYFAFPHMCVLVFGCAVVNPGFPVVGGPNSFTFTQISAKKHPHRRLVPPTMGWVPLGGAGDVPWIRQCCVCPVRHYIIFLPWVIESSKGGDPGILTKKPWNITDYIAIDRICLNVGDPEP